MKILIANPGSTSYKCKLFDMENTEVVFQATVDRIGDQTSTYSYRFSGKDQATHEKEIRDYLTAIHLTLEALQKEIPLEDISAIGFKTVLAKDVTGCVELSKNVIEAMEAYQTVAPVHTSVYLNAISIFEQLVPDIPRIGLFETAFHTTIPSYAYLYGIPYEYYQDHGIRKYGFHGASHRYIAERAEELHFKQKDNYRLISCHLGGSASVCAIKDGVSLDTSMGMSPQSGLLNANRVGDLDPFALLYLLDKENLSLEEIREILISRGGVAGISGTSGDLRDVIQKMNNGDERAQSAFKTFAYYVRRYVGEYLAVLNGADIIVFTAGSGQNSPELRQEILKDMENLGIVLDDKKNTTNPDEGLISADQSPVKIAIIPTNEEIIVAREVAHFLSQKGI